MARLLSASENEDKRKFGHQDSGRKRQSLRGDTLRKLFKNRLPDILLNSRMLHDSVGVF